MAENRIEMKGNEFVEKLLSGEKDFSRIHLEPFFALSADERFAEVLMTFTQVEMEESPIVLDNADCTGLDADGLCLPFLQAQGSCFKRATFMDADLPSANFSEADFRYARFLQADLSSCNLQGADLRQADLNLAKLNQSQLDGADFAGSNLLYTNMQSVYINGVVNLDRARFVETVNFQFVQLSDRERTVIRSELWEQQGKKRRLFGGTG